MIGEMCCRTSAAPQIEAVVSALHTWVSGLFHYVHFITDTGSAFSSEPVQRSGTKASTSAC
ncbi:hypothetical protein M407DRAFT_196634 [Tulasnella calospora MUT 4182]|uniref:Uncharacterized protein n=1 Tax=Tulasnella calospora MUT 4182 TaxID=1051891 RepID=A0A0C3LZL1_9AGAM|nr:hypothetical protein M407DRAFT_196634 [Tulasnella calospora MUT 4182]